MTKKRFYKLTRAFISRAGVLTKENNRKLSDYYTGIKTPAPYANLWDAISSPVNLGVGVKQK